MGKQANLEDQLAVKKALVEEFNLIEIKVTKSYLDCLDIVPDPNNPLHWDILLKDRKNNAYINLKFFPSITIEPLHTDEYNLGKINYETGMTPNDVVKYVYNILSKE